jgi:hypothetical protein
MSSWNNLFQHVLWNRWGQCVQIRQGSFRLMTYLASWVIEDAGWIHDNNLKEQGDEGEY